MIPEPRRRAEQREQRELPRRARSGGPEEDAHAGHTASSQAISGAQQRRSAAPPCWTRGVTRSGRGPQQRQAQAQGPAGGSSSSLGSSSRRLMDHFNSSGDAAAPARPAPRPAGSPAAPRDARPTNARGRRAASRGPRARLDSSYISNRARCRSWCIPVVVELAYLERGQAGVLGGQLVQRLVVALRRANQPLAGLGVEQRHRHGVVLGHRPGAGRLLQNKKTHKGSFNSSCRRDDFSYTLRSGGGPSRSAAGDEPLRSPAATKRSRKGGPRRPPSSPSAARAEVRPAAHSDISDEPVFCVHSAHTSNQGPMRGFDAPHTTRPAAPPRTRRRRPGGGRPGWGRGCTAKRKGGIPRAPRPGWRANEGVGTQRVCDL
ncbi:hypothetical protein L1887_52088 [Cichorium endivia]|nr:hypothetical protein L1887_52088 [Cichorium endivia]